MRTTSTTCQYKLSKKMCHISEMANLYLISSQSKVIEMSFFQESQFGLFQLDNYVSIFTVDSFISSLTCRMQVYD